MLKAFKYRIYPTKTQIQLIEKHFDSTRFLYNYFLDYRQKYDFKVRELLLAGQIFDVEKFNRIFKKVVGQNPIQFKKN